MNAVDLDALDVARAKATPGEWHIAGSGGIDAGDYDTVIGSGDVDCMAHCYGGTSTIEGDNLPADAALIVAAVNALPELVADARTLRVLRDAVLGLADELDGERDNYGYAIRNGLKPGPGDRLRATVTAALGEEGS